MFARTKLVKVAERCCHVAGVRHKRNCMSWLHHLLLPSLSFASLIYS